MGVLYGFRLWGGGVVVLQRWDAAPDDFFHNRWWHRHTVAAFVRRCHEQAASWQSTSLWFRHRVEPFKPWTLVLTARTPLHPLSRLTRFPRPSHAPLCIRTLDCMDTDNNCKPPCAPAPWYRRRVPCRIELSRKVLIDMERLRSTLAHEMCHVAGTWQHVVSGMHKARSKGKGDKWLGMMQMPAATDRCVVPYRHVAAGRQACQRHLTRAMYGARGV